MIEVKRVFSECKADTMLAEIILQRGNPAHHKGIVKVCDAIIKFESNNYVIGIVDRDKFKRDTGPINKFSELVQDRTEAEGLLILKKPNTNKYVIRLCPAFEKWIWKVAEQNHINHNDYGFMNIDDLIQAAKSHDVHDHPELIRFVKKVIRHDPSPIKTLRSWLEKVFNPN